jgi:hypothetical protein
MICSTPEGRWADSARPDLRGVVSMRPVRWSPPIEPSAAEQTVIGGVRRAKLFVFLRLHRHEVFDEQFQAELGRIYRDSPSWPAAGAARAAGAGVDPAGLHRCQR